MIMRKKENNNDENPVNTGNSSSYFKTYSTVNQNTHASTFTATTLDFNTGIQSS